MAGNTGPEDGAGAVRVEPVRRSEDEAGPRRNETRPDDRLDPGEPSWPEDPNALRVEALSGEATPAAAAGSSGPGEASPPHIDADAEISPVTSGGAGSPWDWDGRSESATAEAPASDRLTPGGDSDDTIPEVRVIHDAEAPASAPDPVPPSSEPWAAGPGVLASASTAASAPPPRRRGGIGALLLGGMIAAALGFGAAWIARDRLGPAALPLPAELEERLALLEARPVPDESEDGAEIQSLSDRLAEAEARLQALEDTAPAAAPSVDLEPLRQEIAAGLDQAQSRAAELEERLAALEARPATPGPVDEGPGPAVRAPAAPATIPAAGEAAAALEPRLAEIEIALSEVEAALASIEERVAAGDEALAGLDQQVARNATALADLDQRLGAAEEAGAAAVEEARAATVSLQDAQARAAEAETRARTGAALAALDAAVAQGEPFDAALSDLQATGTAVPDTLAQAAPQGVPTLASLREEFPEAARAGLAAARETGLVDDGGVMGFLRGQLSVRSTAPREGEDPDAVLSRAEAAVADGQLDLALREVGTLPEPVRAAMADWIARAQARAEAQAALATLRGAEPAAAPAD